MKKKKLTAFLACCLVGSLLTACGAGNADIDQPAWRLLSAEQVQDGIEVEIGGENLLLKKGVRITADSQESKEFAADLAADGISDEDGLRWSSENDWEDNEHWLQAEFSQVTQIGYVKIFWERTNACAYALEYSADGKNWETAAAFDSTSAQKEQNICLDEPVEAKYLRLHVTDVTKEEADLSLYYQNVSVLEMEVYEAVEDRFVIETPQVEAGEDRTLELPQVPQGYELALGGADYENLLTSDGELADALDDVMLEIGFVLGKEEESWELPGMTVHVPASRSEAETQVSEGGQPAGVMEWKASEGVWTASDSLCLSVEEADTAALADVAALFEKELAESELFADVQGDGESGTEAGGKEAGADAGKTESGTAQAQGAAAGVGRIHLRLSESGDNSLGDEGYEICVEESGITISANTAQGVRWGCVTLLDWMEQEAGDAAGNVNGAAYFTLQAGTARDYPRYSVRGFGIDVGRRAISMDLLYRIVEAMSQQKMNTLQIHLNDNQIIAQSEYDGTVEGARSLYASFRLESDLKNEDGAGITSTDLYYTKEEFMELIETAAAYGVEIVPEIDTPAHSLAFTKVFPNLGFSKDPESVDQLDLSKKEARQLIKDLWAEYLSDGTGDAAEGSVFENCTALHLGMDEYYGKDSAYVSYLEELSAYVQELAPEKELRIWGSLSKLEADYSSVSRDLQMHVWDTDWANPQDMYDEGFFIINSLSSSLYIIPGGGYDELDLEFLEKEWQPNLFLTAERDWELPAWSERMLGACYMMWNDWSWANGDEITEDSLFERFEKPLPILADKLWGKNAISF